VTDTNTFLKANTHNRFQSVRVSSTYSSICGVISGVPQGSVFGPVLFILFVNDITDCMVDNVAVKLFADDTKIYTVIDDVIISSNQLQLSLDLVAAWADHWQLKLSLLKYSVILEIDYPHILVPPILLELTAFLLSPSARIWASPMIIISILNHMFVGLLKRLQAEQNIF